MRSGRLGDGRFWAAAAAALASWAWPAADRPPANHAAPAEPPPISPFAPRPQSPPRTDARPGALTFSDGRSLAGKVMLTRGRPLEFFEETKQKWHAFDLAELARIELEVAQETKQAEWRWKEGGSDVKVYTGRSYVDREYRATVTLAGSRTRLTGYVKGAPVFLEDAQGRAQRFLLLWKDRGEMDQPPEKLVYLKAVVLDAPAP